MFKNLKNTVLDVNASNASLPKGSTLATVSAVGAGVVASSPMVFATATTTSSSTGIKGFFDKIKEFLKQIYDGVDLVMTASVVTVIAICLLMRVFSKNPRSVDEATSWMKRAIITLIVWKFLGLFTGTIEDASKGNEYKWK